MEKRTRFVRTGAKRSVFTEERTVGRFTTCVIAQDGSLACAGRNGSGELGVGDTEDRPLLTPVAFE